MTAIRRRQHAIESFGILAFLVLPGACAQAHRHAEHGQPALPDSAFAALQERGQVAMGVDQYTSAHRFEALADGGRIELRRAQSDSAGQEEIRRHLRSIAEGFTQGDFATPGFVHAREVPGTRVMSERRNAISYSFRELPRGGEVRITSVDPQAIRAIHEFLQFQREEHRAGAGSRQ